MQENTPFRRRGAKIENIGFGYEKEKALKQNVSELSTMAAGEGFEPSHTESESAVLPLHNPARHVCHYTRFCRFVKGNGKIIFGR